MIPPWFRFVMILPNQAWQSEFISKLRIHFHKIYHHYNYAGGVSGCCVVGWLRADFGQVYGRSWHQAARGWRRQKAQRPFWRRWGTRASSHSTDQRPSMHSTLTWSNLSTPSSRSGKAPSPWLSSKVRLLCWYFWTKSKQTTLWSTVLSIQNEKFHILHCNAFLFNWFVDWIMIMPF